MVDALSLGQGVEVVEHFEQAGRGLVDGANDGPAATREGFQQGHALEAGGAVQAAGRFVEEHYWRVADKF